MKMPMNCCVLIKKCLYFSLDIFASIIDGIDYNTMDEHIREFRTVCLGILKGARQGA